MDGIDVCRRLRAGSAVPIIVVTARCRGGRPGAAAWSWAPTTMWSSRSGSASWWPASGPCTRRARPARGAAEGRQRLGRLEIDRRAPAGPPGRGRGRRSRPRSSTCSPCSPRTRARCSRREQILAQVWDAALVRARPRPSTCTWPRCARSWATPAGSRPCAASASGWSPSHDPAAAASYLSITAFVLLTVSPPRAHLRRRRTRPAGRRRGAGRHRGRHRGRGRPRGRRHQRARPGRGRLPGRTGGRVVVVDRHGVTWPTPTPPAPGRRDLSTRPEIAAALAASTPTGTRVLGDPRRRPSLCGRAGRLRRRVHGAVRITYPTADGRRPRAPGLAGPGRGRRGGARSSWPLVGFALARCDHPAGAPTGAGDHGRWPRGRPGGPRAGPTGPPELRRLAAAFNDMADQAGRLLDAQRAVRGRRLPPAAHPADRAAAAAGEPRPTTRRPAASPSCRPRSPRPTGWPGWSTACSPWPAPTPAPPPPVPSTSPTWSPTGSTRGAPAAEQPASRLTAEPGRGTPRSGRARCARAGAGQPARNALAASPAGRDGAGRAGRREPRGFGRGARHRPGAGDARRAAGAGLRPVLARPGATSAGFGLGLAIVRRLVEASGGTAELRPAPSGRGLRALVRLRATAGTPGENPLPASNLRPASAFPGRS